MCRAYGTAQPRMASLGPCVGVSPPTEEKGGVPPKATARVKIWEDQPRAEELSSTSTVATVASTSGTSSSPPSPSSVRVAVRVRPLLPTDAGSTRCVRIVRSADATCCEGSSSGGSRSLSSGSVASGGTRIVVGGRGGAKGGGGSGASFVFDEVLDEFASQQEVYGSVAAPLVDACLEGYNATVLAYGPTGSGKSHTILGPTSTSMRASPYDKENKTQPARLAAGATDSGCAMSAAALRRRGSFSSGDSAGVIPRALRDLFARLEYKRSSRAAAAAATTTAVAGGRDGQLPFDFKVHVQFLELYGDELRDLIAPSDGLGTPQRPRRRLKIRDAGPGVDPEVAGATRVEVSSVDEAIHLLRKGAVRRATGATAVNVESSRSHAIMTLTVEQTDAGGTEKISEKRISKFHFVDLAGSERQKYSRSEGKRLKEGIDINKGLLALGNVISSLCDPSKMCDGSFVPYRDSKLTHMLRGSLGGNHKTALIACVSPAAMHREESLSCLRYASRARRIRNDAVVNVVEKSGDSRCSQEFLLQALASELLRIRTDDGSQQENEGGAKFPMEMLVALAGGKTLPHHSSGRQTSHEKRMSFAADEKQLGNSFSSHDSNIVVAAASRPQSDHSVGSDNWSNDSERIVAVDMQDANIPRHISLAKSGQIEIPRASLHHSNQVESSKLIAKVGSRRGLTDKEASLTIMILALGVSYRREISNSYGGMYIYVPQFTPVLGRAV